MTQFNPENIRKMAAYLRTVPPELFHMGAVAEEKPCGTVCCIAGYAPDVFPGYERSQRSETGDLDQTGLDGLHGYIECMAHIFGVSRYETDYLTAAYRPSDPIHIANTLDNFAEHRSIERVEAMDALWRGDNK